MSTPVIIASKVSLQAFEHSLQHIGRLSDTLDIVAFEVRQIHKTLKDVYETLRLKADY